MELTYTVIYPDGMEERRTAVLSATPSYAEVRFSIIDPILGQDVFLERGSALQNGITLQLLCDEDAPLQSQPINALATALFQAAWRDEMPDADPDNLPEIYGTAVLLPAGTCSYKASLTYLHRIGRDWWPKGYWSIVDVGPGLVVERCDSTGDYRSVYRDGRIEAFTAPNEGTSS